MPFCENCGSLLGNDTKYCGSCGANAKAGQQIDSFMNDNYEQPASNTTSNAAESRGTGCRLLR
jgi:DNA-directed RNA polymerase subunit M/transcription elongation factor TFIIS